jgi:hypothetical protein
MVQDDVRLFCEHGTRCRCYACEKTQAEFQAHGRLLLTRIGRNSAAGLAILGAIGGTAVPVAENVTMPQDIITWKQCVRDETVTATVETEKHCDECNNTLHCIQSQYAVQRVEPHTCFHIALGIALLRPRWILRCYGMALWHDAATYLWSCILCVEALVLAL